MITVSALRLRAATIPTARLNRMLRQRATIILLHEKRRSMTVERALNSTVVGFLGLLDQ